MKTLFAKFKISSALDEAKPSVSKQPAVSPELRRFEASLRRLDGDLKSSRPTVVLPEGLHASVMRAVREASLKRTANDQPQRAPFKLAWLWTPALAVLLGGLFAWSVLRPRGVDNQPVLVAEITSSLAAAASASLDLSEAVARVVPAALAPLQQELEFAHRDVRKASELIFAALP